MFTKNFITAFARDKTWTYNPNSFNILLDQLSFTSLISLKFLFNSIKGLEISGIEPESITCKVTVLPLNYIPLRNKKNFSKESSYKFILFFILEICNKNFPFVVQIKQNWFFIVYKNKSKKFILKNKRKVKY